MKRKMRIHKGDTVEIVTGREQDKGTRAEVIKVIPKQNRVVVQGVNIRKKHQRQIQQQGRTMTPGIIEFEGSIDVSNVILVCPSCGEASRVGIQRDEDGLPHRVCKSCDEQID